MCVECFFTRLNKSILRNDSNAHAHTHGVQICNIPNDILWNVLKISNYLWQCISICFSFYLFFVFDSVDVAEYPPKCKVNFVSSHFVYYEYGMRMYCGRRHRRKYSGHFVPRYVHFGCENRVYLYMFENGISVTLHANYVKTLGATFYKCNWPCEMIFIYLSLTLPLQLSYIVRVQMIPPPSTHPSFGRLCHFVYVRWYHSICDCTFSRMMNQLWCDSRNKRVKNLTSVWWPEWEWKEVRKTERWENEWKCVCEFDACYNVYGREFVVSLYRCLH